MDISEICRRDIVSLGADATPQAAAQAMRRGVGAHARSAVGMAELPFRIPVEIEGEVALAG